MPRHAGLNLPLSSIRSASSWGIGEIQDLRGFGSWLQRAGFDRVLLLPLGTMADGQASPYSAVSTLAIDPIYISIDPLDDFARAGGHARLSVEAQRALAAARRSPTLQFDRVRRAKREGLHLAFQAFVEGEWSRHTARAEEFRAFIAREQSWLDDYALFQALARSMPGRDWRVWPAPLRDREPEALASARRVLENAMLEQQYLQWIAETQWQTARTALAAQGVRIVGDLPFVANADSPEIWARQHEFDLTVSTGVPPDAFSDTGQDWGLPFYRWDVIARGGYDWMRERLRRMARVFDAVRVDHVIGLYRTYGRPAAGGPFFSPADQASQVAQGETMLRLIQGSGLAVIAEDLGVIPDFVRESLERLDIPGCKVLRWERDWHGAGAPFLNPATYPATSAAMTGTHDTTTLAAWWSEADTSEREAFLALPALRDAGLAGTTLPWTTALRDGVIAMMYGSSATDVFFPIQDVFGWPDRINVPGTVGDSNWTWCLPWPIEDVDVLSDAQDRAAFLGGLARANGRGSIP